MNGREKGFLLLSSHLGDPARKVLTTAQLRRLGNRAGMLPREDRELTEQDLVGIGYDRPMAERILKLLADEEQLRWYVDRGARQGCVPITRVSRGYPERIRFRLGLDCPGCLWAKGDRTLLEEPAVALVGCRELAPANREFAAEAGRQAALQGYALVSGNARGADKAAQEACLAAGGRVIAVVADRLEDRPEREGLLYLSEDGYDLAFSAQRALSRNRIIHALGIRTLVAQCDLEKGGTWSGTVNNLKAGYSPVFCLEDGSDAVRALIQRGATPVGIEALGDLSGLQPDMLNFIGQ